MRGMPLVSALDSHFAVLFDSSCFIGCSVDISKLDWLFQGFRVDPQSFGGLVVDEIVHRATV